MTDKDFVIDNPGTGDTSCNQIGEVVIEGDDKNIIKSDVHSLPDDSSEIYLMFNKRINDIPFSSDVYKIQLIVKVFLIYFVL